MSATHNMPHGEVRVRWYHSKITGKWRRACQSSTQLSTYFVGAIEHDDMRAAAEKKLGGKFETEELPPANLKGKEKPFRIFDIKRAVPSIQVPASLRQGASQMVSIERQPY